MRAGLHVLHPRVPPLDTQLPAQGLGPRRSSERDRWEKGRGRKDKQREGRLSPTRQDWVMTESPRHTFLGWPRVLPGHSFHGYLLGIYSVPHSVLLLQVLWRKRQVQPSPWTPRTGRISAAQPHAVPPSQPLLPQGHCLLSVPAPPWTELPKERLGLPPP